MGDYNISPSLDGLQAIFLDLDGTIYLGGKLISGALDFLDRCGEKGVARFFLSNNSSRSTSQYRKKLSVFGIEVEEDEILLSTRGVQYIFILLGLMSCLLFTIVDSLSFIIDA